MRISDVYILPGSKMKFSLPQLVVCLILLVFAQTTSNAQCSVSCTYTVTASTATNYDVTSGQKLCVTASGADVVLSGSVTVRNGGAMEVCSDASDEVRLTGSWNFFDAGARTIDIYGNFEHTVGSTFDKETTVSIHAGATFTTTALNTNGNDVDINNDGTLTTSGNFTISGTSATTTNNGTLDVGGNITLNNSATLINTNDINVTSNTEINKGTFINSGSVDGGGFFRINDAASDFSNTGTATFTGDITLNSGSYSNSGTVESGAKLTVNGSASVDLSGGIFIADDLTFNGGNFTAGTGSNCAAFLIKDQTVINNGVILPAGALVEITDSTTADSVNTNNCGASQCGLTFNSNNSCYTTLPIHLWKFWVADANNKTVSLRWATIEEINNDYFTVERSIDGEHFESIGSVAGAGNTHEMQYYSLEDNQVPIVSVVYYRLRQTDFDQKTTVSYVVPVHLNELGISLFPIPNQGKNIHVLMSNVDQLEVPVSIVNALGVEVYQGQFSSRSGEVNEVVQFETDLPSNVYTVVFGLQSGTEQRKFVVY